MRVTNCVMNPDDNVLSMYFNEISKIPLLTREEEVELATKAAKGDKAAKDKLVQANLRFVVNVAKKHQNHGLDLVDLISEGNSGLMTAIDHFDVSKGYHFISYAVWWIRQAILKAIGEKSRMIRLPLNRGNELVQIAQARKSITAGQSKDEEISQIAKMLGMSEQLVQELLSISRDMVSLDVPIGNDDDSNMTHGDNLADSKLKTSEDIVMENQLRDTIRGALASLAKRDAMVLRCRFGLDGTPPMSLKEVGDKLNLSRERIRQIERKALYQLKTSDYTERLRAFVE